MGLDPFYYSLYRYIFWVAMAVLLTWVWADLLAGWLLRRSWFAPRYKALWCRLESRWPILGPWEAAGTWYEFNELPGDVHWAWVELLDAMDAAGAEQLPDGRRVLEIPEEVSE